MVVTYLPPSAYVHLTKKILESSQAPLKSYIKLCIFVLHTGMLTYAPLGQTFPLEIVVLMFMLGMPILVTPQVTIYSMHSLGLIHISCVVQQNLP